MVNQLLITVARNAIFGRWVGWVFEHMSNLLPVKRVIETDELIVFWHPTPSYEVHLLIVPKKVIKDFSSVDANGSFWLNLPSVVQDLVEKFELDQKGYRLITNTGEYQDVKQLHFHLVSGETIK